MLFRSADTTLDSGTTTVSTGTDFGAALFVGVTGTATLELVPGADATNGAAYLGSVTTGNGTAIVTGGTWTTLGDLEVVNGSLTMTGGRVAVGGRLSNTASGTINLNSGGTLQIGVGGATGELATTGWLMNEGALVFNRAGAVTYSGTAYGNGRFVNEGPGTVTVGGAIIAYGGATIRSGTVVVPTGGNVQNNDPIVIGDSTGDVGVVQTTGGYVWGLVTSLGRNAGSAGTATLSTGALSADLLEIGASGTGTLNVAGGNANTQLCTIGANAGGVGTATVSAGNWYSNGDLLVGGSGSGTLNLTGGTLFINGRLLQGASGTINLAPGGTLAIGNGYTLGAGELAVPTLTNDGTLIFDRPDDVTYAGVISGSGGVIQQGAATLSLTGSNTYTGTTTISHGRLAVTTDSVKGAIANAAILSFDQSTDGTYSGTISGVGSLTKLGSGTVTLTSMQAFTGSTSISSGALALSGTGGLASSLVTVASGAVLDVSGRAGGMTLANGQTLAGSGTVLGSVVLGGGAKVAPGSSPGTLSITGNATFGSGGNYDWQIYNATGTAGVTNGWDLVTVGGTLAVASTSADRFNINLWSLSGVGPDVNGSALNFNATTSGTWRIASAAGGITGFSADKFTINTSATNGTGGFANSLSGGTFSLAQSGTALNLVFTPAAPTAIVINVGSGSTQTQSQAGYPTISGTLPVSKTGAGTLVFDAVNTYTGTTSVNAGTLLVTNSNALQASPIVVQTGGTLALPSATRLVLSATSLTVDQATGGKIDVGKGRINIGIGGISAADLRADLIAGRSGGSWSGTSGIVTSGSTAGASTLPVVGYRVFTTGSASVAWAAFGDTNLDGQVNFADVTQINNGGKFGQGTSTGAVWLQGDFNYSNGVTFADITLMNNSALFGTGSYLPVAGAAVVASVPEPSTYALAFAGLAALAARRRSSPTIRPDHSAAV